MIIDEAGFYSANLVRYLVEVLYMPITQINYKITIKRALKPDIFKEYIEFEELPEAEAKKMANSFIGELGQKINNGFTCSEYDTAMCCWTSAMNERRNLTIDHNNGLYMIRKQKVKRLFSDNTSINCFVVTEAITTKCLQLIDCCSAKDSVFPCEMEFGIPRNT